MATWQEGGGFRERLLADAEVTAALEPGAEEKLAALFNPRHHLDHLDHVYREVFGEPGPPPPRP
jgi:adenylosuccinate lyase